MAVEKPKRPNLRISRVLRELHRDDVALIESTYQNVCAAAKEHGGVAEMTLKIKVKPTQGGEADITADCTSRLPRRKPRPVSFFITDDNDLAREDPNQASLDLQDSEVPPGKVSPMPPTRPAAAVSPMPHPGPGTAEAV